MALNLLSLLGQQASSDTIGPDILVENKVPAIKTSGLDLGGINVPTQEMPLEPNKLSAKQLRDQSELANLPERSGRFGVKGTLRDVLGTLGDAFLVQAGRNPMYSAKREQEKISDAMAGFVQNPLEAIQRIATENPEFAQKLLENYQDRGYQDEVLSAKRVGIEQEGQRQRFELAAKARDRVSRLLASAKTPEEVAWVMSQAEGLAGRAGLTMEDLGLGDNLTPEQRGLYATGDMTVNQQQQIPLRQRQLEIAAQNAASNARRVNRPPTGRNPTEASIAAPLLRKLQSGQTLTTYEQEVLNRTAPLPSTRGRGSGRQTSTTGKAITGKMVFRNGKLVQQ